MYQKPLHQLDIAISAITDFLDLYSQWAKQQGWLPNELFALYSIAHHQNCKQKDIADDWCLPKQTVSGVCQQLIQKELIVAIAHPTDKRHKILRLTAKGQALVLPILQRLNHSEQSTIAQFGEQRLQQLTQDIQDLSRFLQDNLDIKDE